MAGPKPRKYAHLYGPVPSRRLGRSLGVDVTPFKTCSFDCIFCQLGRTTEKTVARKEYVPTDRILAEITAWLKSGEHADCITLSGSGEPTLHTGFGEVLKLIGRHAVPAVLLTNGSMLMLPEVRQGALSADIVKVSLSAWDPASFQWINRPHKELAYGDILEGLRAFRSEYPGRLWIEVFLIPGMNASPDKTARIAEMIRPIEPDRVHLNTAVRPPAEDFVAPLSRGEMHRFAEMFDPPAKVTAECYAGPETRTGAGTDAILSMLRRRPCTTEQIAAVYGMHIAEVSKVLGDLLRRGRIREKREKGAVYYAAKQAGRNEIGNTDG